MDLQEQQGHLAQEDVVTPGSVLGEKDCAMSEMSLSDMGISCIPMVQSPGEAHWALRPPSWRTTPQSVPNHSALSSTELRTR